MYPEQLMHYGGESFLSTTAQAEKLAHEYQTPKEDVIHIALNLSGVHHQNVINDRGRFDLIMPGSNKPHRVALTITNSPDTRFAHDGSHVLLGDEVIGKATEIEKDTCTDTYWRSATHLTLNSNSRSVCKGCNFCGTYSLERADEPLNDESRLAQRANQLSQEVGGFSHIEAIGVVTGCFPGEQPIVEHIKSIRKVFSQFGFKGEIQYIGSQLKSEQAIGQLIDDGPFALYLTTEIFSRREALMKKQKSSLSLEEGRMVLQRTKMLGGQSSFLYIAGLDTLETIYEELPKFAGIVTRFPQLQTYQLYTPDQQQYRAPGANKLDYYLKLRQFAEQQFSDLKPILFHNYRGLWYSQYRGQAL